MYPAPSEEPVLSMDSGANAMKSDHWMCNRLVRSWLERWRLI